MASSKAERTVFIGNIPYGLTEEQIIQICSSVGQVLSFRLVYDNDTGKPKGFGFAEFADTDAASSAVRNLDKHNIQGRELRVDFSKKGDTDGSGGGGGGAANTFSGGAADMAAAQQQQQQQQHIAQPGANGVNPVGPLPPGVELPPGMSCPDVISETLNTLPTPQLLDIVTQMKGLVMGDPARATELLKQAPQLSYAIFQALLLMGLVDSSLLGSIVEQAQAGIGGGPGGGMPVGIQTSAQQLPARPFQQGQQPPPGQMGGYVPTPPLAQTPFQVPPQQQQQHQPQQPPPMQMQQQQMGGGAPLGGGGGDQMELIKQLLQMPQGDIDRLGPAERAQIMQLKQQYGSILGY